MFNKEKYGRILIPMVTPFKEDQSVDYDAAAELARILIEKQKGDSLILSGTTGEFHTMNFAERAQLLKVVMEAVGKQIPLIAGIGCASTIETIQLGQEAEKLGYELVMVVAPYYVKPNQREIFEHFKRVAEALKLQILLYNIPIFTGVNINPETVAELAKIDNIVGIKEEAELTPKQMTEFINVTADDFIIYDGDDTMLLEAYAQGGTKRIGGIVSGAAHLIGDRLREEIDAFISGDVQKAAEIQQQLLPLFRVMGQNNRINPVCLWKEAMIMAGYPAGCPRLPLLPGTEEEKAKVRAELERLAIL